MKRALAASSVYAPPAVRQSHPPTRQPTPPVRPEARRDSGTQRPVADPNRLLWGQSNSVDKGIELRPAGVRRLVEIGVTGRIAAHTASPWTSLRTGDAYETRVTAKGHPFETNCGGHRLRQVATLLVRESASDRGFEVLHKCVCSVSNSVSKSHFKCPPDVQLDIGLRQRPGETTNLSICTATTPGGSYATGHPRNRSSRCAMTVAAKDGSRRARLCRGRAVRLCSARRVPMRESARRSTVEASIHANHASRALRYGLIRCPSSGECGPRPNGTWSRFWPAPKGAWSLFWPARGLDGQVPGRTARQTDKIHRSSWLNEHDVGTANGVDADDVVTTTDAPLRVDPGSHLSCRIAH
jgi:hypothetical protein